MVVGLVDWCLPHSFADRLRLLRLPQRAILHIRLSFQIILVRLTFRLAS